MAQFKATLDRSSLLEATGRVLALANPQDPAGATQPEFDAQCKRVKGLPPANKLCERLGAEWPTVKRAALSDPGRRDALLSQATRSKPTQKPGPNGRTA